MHVDGRSLELHDIVVYPATDDALPVGAAHLLAAARGQVFPELVRLGFQTLLVTGTRLTGSRPGRRVQVRIDLLREVS